MKKHRRISGNSLDYFPGVDVVALRRVVGGYPDDCLAGILQALDILRLVNINVPLLDDG